MKKNVICAKELEEAFERGERVYSIDRNDIVTPAAKDVAKNNKIEIVYKANKEIDMEKFLETFRLLIKEGMLESVIKELSKKENYTLETDESGLKIIRGSSIKMKKIEGKNIKYREFENFHREILIGMIDISQDNFERNLKYEEVNYILSGEIKIEINEKIYFAKEGDIILLPKENKIDFISLGESKILYMSPKSNMEGR